MPGSSSCGVLIEMRVPPGLGEESVRRRIAEVLGEESPQLRIEFTEQVVGNASAVQSDLMVAIDRWVSGNDPGATVVPMILPGFSDSRWFRDAFPSSSGSAGRGWCWHRPPL